jgi:hypothetical protein
MLKRTYRRFQQYNYSLTVILITLLIAFYSYQDFTKWSIIRLIRAQGPMTYVDTNTVIYYANCFSEIGSEVYAEGTFCSNWNYGSTVLKVVNFLSITSENTTFIGHFFTYSILATFVYLLHLIKAFKHAQIVMFFGFLSPSVWLLLERANFDSLIYLMVFLSALLFRKGFELTAIGLIVFTALFKFYTLPLLIILLFLTTKLHVKIINIIGFSLGTYIILGDFRLMGGMSMQAGNNHFGMKIIGNYLGKLGVKLGNIEVYFLGAVLFLAAIVFVILIISKKEPQLFQDTLFSEKIVYIYIFMSSIFLISFSVGLSVDYRLVFYLASAPILVTLLKSRISYLFSGSFLVGAWFCYPAGLFQPFGDLNLELIAGFQIVVLFITTFLKKTSILSSKF